MAKKTAAVDIVVGGNATKQLNDLTGSVKSLKDQVKEAQKEAQLLAAQFGVTSKEATEAQKRLTDLKEELNDFNERVGQLDPGNKFKTIGTAVNQVAGGFAAAQGAAALFGAESEDLQKTLVKLQGALALSQGLDQLKDVGKTLGSLKVIGVDALKSIGDAFKANPFFLGATVALTAISAAWGILASKTDETTKEIEQYNKEIDKSIEQNRKRASAVEKGYDREIELAKAAGKETFELEKEKLQATISRVTEEISLLIRKREFEKKLRGEQIKELQEDFLGGGFTRLVSKALNDQLVKDTKKKNDDIKKLNEELKDFQVNLQSLELSETKKNNDKAVELTKDRLAKQAQAEKDAILNAQSRKEREEAEDEEFLAKSERDAKRREEELKAIEEFNGLKLNASIVDGQRQLAEEEKILQRKKELREAEIQIATSLVSTLASLGNILIKNQEKNEAFQKKVAAVQLAIDTAKAVSGAIAQAQSLPFPGNVVAIAAGVAAVLSNIAKAKELLSKVGASGSIQLSVPTSSPSVSLPDFANQPTINSTGVNQQQTDVQGSQVNQMVYITQGQLEENEAQANSLNSKVQLR